MFWLNLFAAGFLVVVVFQWALTLRAYRNMPLILLERTVFNSLRTDKRFLFAASVLGMLASFGTVLLPEYFPPLPLGFSLAVSLTALSYACLPPALLLLGASRPGITLLLNELNQAISPLRLTHLLDTTQALAGPFFDTALHQTKGRALGRVSWKAVVYELMDTVPLIVVDTRTATPAVIEETILAFQYPYKSLFVVGEGNSSQVFALLSHRLGFIPPSAQVVTVEQAPSFAREMLLGRKGTGGATGEPGFDSVSLLKQLGASDLAVEAALRYQSARLKAGGPTGGTSQTQRAIAHDPARFDKYRDGFAPRPGPPLHYRDEHLQFSFVLPGGWSFGRRIAPFGCVAISRHGPLVVRAGEVEDHLNDRATRKTELFNHLHSRGFTDVVSIQEGRTFAGEENVIFYSYVTPGGDKGFGISAVRYLIQYNIQADRFPSHFLKDTVDALESSFRFATKERVNYLKKLSNV